MIFPNSSHEPCCCSLHRLKAIGSRFVKTQKKSIAVIDTRWTEGMDLGLAIFRR